jgi:hypothetical protein
MMEAARTSDFVCGIAVRAVIWNKVMSVIFGERRLQKDNEELHNSYSSSNIILVINE